MQNTKPVVLFDIDYTLFDTALFKQSELSKSRIYEEVFHVLDNLSNSVTLGIFSKGETLFQKTKLEKTGIMKFFKKENVHIFDDKDINLVKIIDKYKGFKIFFVDDKLEILYSAKKYMPQIITVWVKRGPYAKTQVPIENFTPNVTIDNLSNLYNIVSSN